jgi:transcriptional regulator with XRE-family HTH domain
VPEVRSPTVRRRQLGGILRSLRQTRGMTVEQVADALLCSPSKVSRMETGSRGATLRDVRDLCDLYEVTDKAERERLSQLATEGKQQGWWQPYDLDFATYVGLEADATTLTEFSCTIIPGLLQTPAYIRAMHKTAVPIPAPERIEEYVEVRLTRQRLLTRDPPLRLVAVLDEAMLHRVVGGPAVMEEQLERLIAAARMPNITIRVIANAAGAHPAMESNFSILELSNSAPSVVYVEGLVGRIYLERSQDITRYREVFERLLDFTLNTDQSIELMSDIRAEYKTRTAVPVFNT